VSGYRARVWLKISHSIFINIPDYFTELLSQHIKEKNLTSWHFFIIILGDYKTSDTKKLGKIKQ